MDFLKNLAKNVYTGANKAVSTIGGALSGNSSRLSASAASSKSSADQRVSQALSKSGITTSSRLATPKPNFTPTPQESARLNQENALRSGTNYSSPSVAPTSVRSATRSTGSSTERTTNSEGRLGTLNTKSGKFTPDPQGAQGESGVTAQSFAPSGGSSFNPLATTAGRTGVSGTSAYTGLLTSSGSGANTPAIGDPEGTRDPKKRDASGAQNFNVKQPVPLRDQMQVSDFGSPIDASSLAIPEDVKLMLQSRESMSRDDLLQTRDRLAAVVEEMRFKIEASNPTPPEPVVDTAAQLAYLKQFMGNDQTSVRTQMDDARRALGLTDMQAQKMDVQKQLNAITEAYTQITDDIKNNPDMPKGLAAKRLAKLGEEQKLASMQLLGQLDILTTQIADANEQLNFEFQIIQEENDREVEKQRQIRESFGMLVQAGALGGFTDEDIMNWSEKTGIPEGALLQIRADSLAPEYDFQSVNDQLVRINKKTGEVETMFDGRSGGVGGSGGGGFGGVGGLSQLGAAVMANPQLFDQLTPTEKSKVIPELQAAGFKFPQSLTGEQAKASINAQSALLALSNIKNAIFHPTTGTLDRGRLAIAKTGLGDLAFQIREAQDVLTRIRTGAALNESEITFYSKQIPGVFDSNKSAGSKVQQLAALYAGVAGTPVTLQSPDGQSYVYDNMYDPNQRLEVRQALQAGWKLTNF